MLRKPLRVQEITINKEIIFRSAKKIINVGK